MANNKYKLLVIDIDGTLLDKDGTISTENREALARVMAQGIPVSLSTGRATLAAKRIIDQLSLDGYHVFFDGALVCNLEEGKEVYAEPVDKMVVKQAVEFTRANKVNLDFYSATRYFIERETWASDIRRRFFGTEPAIIDFNNLWQQERIIKGTLTVRTPEERAEADRFYLQFKDSLCFSWTKTPAYPEVDFINAVAPDVSKGKALEALTAFLGIDTAEVMAIGDGANDISLLTSAGLAIAMANAPDEVKAAADYITLDVEHSGLAAAINEFLL